MTVSELITQLQQVDGNLPISTIQCTEHDTLGPHIDVTAEWVTITATDC
jgi:hypothetical protein